jgi:hypothetical protein
MQKNLLQEKTIKWEAATLHPIGISRSDEELSSVRSVPLW